MPNLVQRHGAFINKDGTTHFALWAPDARSVALKLNEKDIYQLDNNNIDGWFTSTLECGEGTTYSFIIDDELEVPDPAARSQLNDVHGLSCVVDQTYPWKSVTWQGRPWHESVIYEVHVGVLGGFKKIEAMLPSLLDLGITAIELMPINEFPGRCNWGYDGVLLFSPESTYGSSKDLKSLIDTAHSLGLMVYLDVVYNHFGPDGNYIGQYAKSFFRNDIHTPWGAAIDFRKQEVKDFFYENALMWILDYRFDGLRLDAVHAIGDETFLKALAARVRKAILPSRHVHLMLENEDNNADLLKSGFDAQWNDDGHNVLHHLLTGEKESYYEDFASEPTQKLARCLSEGFIYQGDATRHGKSRGQPSSHLPATSFILFLQNHDQIGNRALGERLSLLANPDAHKAAVVLQLLSPMIPLLFMGEEWGSKQPFLFFTDHNEELAKAVCEGRRKEFADFKNFSDESSRAKIPDPNSYSTFAHSLLDYAVSNSGEHKEWLDFYRYLLELRRTEIVPRLVNTHSAGVTIFADGALCASWIMNDDNVLRIYINLSSAPVEAIPAWSSARLIFNHRVEESDFANNILPPNSAFVTMDEKAAATVMDNNLESLETNTFVLIENDQ